MNLQTLDDAVAEAKEFIRRAKLVPTKDGYISYEYPSETGALRRQSMELTRALARMRMPG